MDGDTHFLVNVFVFFIVVLFELFDFWIVWDDYVVKAVYLLSITKLLTVWEFIGFLRAHHDCHMKIV